MLVSKNGAVALWSAAAAVLLGAGLANAAPVYSPFLSVDFNSNQSGSYSNTETGFTGFNVAYNDANTSTAALTQTVGSYTVSVSPNPSATGAHLSSRDRGAQGSSANYSDLYRDFALELRDSGHALGYSYLEIQVSGLTAGGTYEFTGFGDDPNSVSSAATYNDREAFSATKPTEYAPGSSPTTGVNYTPVFTAPNGEYDNSVSFDVTADNTGTVTVYAWGDANSYSGQTATIVNGFQLGAVPEPTSLGLLGLGGLGLLARRRKA